MTFREVLRLSHRELSAYKTRSRATVITIGILFGVLLGVLLMAQGLENIVLKYARSFASSVTDGDIYLVSSYYGYPDDDAETKANHAQLIKNRIASYNGEIVTLTPAQKELVNESDFPDPAIIARFHRLSDAYDYDRYTDAKELHYNTERYEIMELFSNQVFVYGYFRQKNHDFIRPITVILIAVSAFILAFTMAHLITNSTKTFVLYRSIGASKKQLLAIYFTYLLRLCARAALFAIAVAIILAGIVTALAWNYLLSKLAKYYPDTPQYLPILLGMNLRIPLVLGCMFLSAPLSFLLCLDQFSNKKIAEKLKGD